MAEKKPKADLSEIGSTGLAEFSGSIRDDFLAELRGKEGYKRYNEMRLNSPVISGLLMSIEQPLRQLSWYFESDKENDPRVEFLEEAKEGMSLSWNDHITEALTMLPFGFCVFEIVYERNAKGQITWHKFGIRGQDTIVRWLYSDTGSLAGFEQVSAPKYEPVTIPIEKAVVYRTRVERGNPEGRSILRAAWIPYYFSKHIQQIEAIGIERDLAGMPVITLPQSADTADTETSDFGLARKLVRNIRNDEQAGVVLPGPEWTLQLLSTGGSRQFDTDKIVRRYESRMLMAALAQFLLLGQDGTGSFSLSADQTDFFNLSLSAVADILADTFTKYAAARLLALNGWDAEGVKLCHSKVGKEDLAAVGAFLQQVQPGLTWGAEDEVWLRSISGMPERDVEELKAEMEEKQANKDAAAAALRQNLEKAKVEKEETPAEGEDEEEGEAEEMAATAKLAAKPIDQRKRRSSELKMQRALTKYLDGQRKRILRSLRDEFTDR